MAIPAPRQVQYDMLPSEALAAVTREGWFGIGGSPGGEAVTESERCQLASWLAHYQSDAGAALRQQVSRSASEPTTLAEIGELTRGASPDQCSHESVSIFPPIAITAAEGAWAVVAAVVLISVLSGIISPGDDDECGDIPCEAEAEESESEDYGWDDSAEAPAEHDAGAPGPSGAVNEDNDRPLFDGTETF